jgi:hypothetical protein
MAIRPPVFTLERDSDPKELSSVRLVEQVSSDGSKQKREVPAADGTSFEAVLYAMSEFEEIAEKINLDTGLGP